MAWRELPSPENYSSTSFAQLGCGTALTFNLCMPGEYGHGRPIAVSVGKRFPAVLDIHSICKRRAFLPATLDLRAV